MYDTYHYHTRARALSLSHARSLSLSRSHACPTPTRLARTPRSHIPLHALSRRGAGAVWCGAGGQVAAVQGEQVTPPLWLSLYITPRHTARLTRRSAPA